MSKTYVNGDKKQLTNLNFEGMSYADLHEVVRKLVHFPVVDLYSEYFEYDAMDVKNKEEIVHEYDDPSDAYNSSDEKDIECVDVFYKGEDNAVVVLAVIRRRL
ncbi:hypothetical protein Tco_1206962, partial [Tanacetum coccineum]